MRYSCLPMKLDRSFARRAWTTLCARCPAPSTRRAPTRPAAPPDAGLLDAEQRRLSGALMRVNHVGEVCAQALYQAQALTARSDALRARDGAGRPRGNRPPGLDAAAPGRAGRPRQPAQPAVVRRGVRHRPARRPRWATASAWASSSRPSARSRRTWPATWTACPRPMRRSRAIVEAMKDDEHRHADHALAAGGVECRRPCAG